MVSSCEHSEVPRLLWGEVEDPSDLLEPKVPLVFNGAHVPLSAPEAKRSGVVGSGPARTLVCFSRFLFQDHCYQIARPAGSSEARVRQPQLGQK